MAYATFTDLPQELVDHFVDFAPTRNLAYLQACSLVCRSLRSPAQRYMFRAVRLMTAERIDVLLEIIRDNALIATYIRKIFTTSQQLSEDYGLDVPLVTFLLRIKEHSPHSRLYLSITKHTTATFEQDSTSERHVTLDGLVYCLSQVRALVVNDVEEFPSIVLFSLHNLEFLWLHHTTFDPELHAIEEEELAELSEPLRKSLVVLRIEKLGYFPSIMVAGIGPQFHVLLVKNVRFAGAAVDTESPRPKILQLALCDYDYGIMESIVDSLVDLSCLNHFRDVTHTMRYKEYDKEDSIQIHRSIRHALNACKDSLQLLSLHCMTEAYSRENPQIPFDLSQLPKLRSLFLNCHCFDEFDNITLPLYIRDILRTIRSETARINRISLSIMLVPISPVPDDRGLARLTLPHVFRQGAWIQIREILDALSRRVPLEFILGVTVMGPFSRNVMRQPNVILQGSAKEAQIYTRMIGQWAVNYFAAGPRRWRFRMGLHLLDSARAAISELNSPISSEHLSSDSEEGEVVPVAEE